MISWNQWLRLFSQPILHVFNHKKLYTNKKKRPFLEGLEERITPVNPSVTSILRNAGTAASTSASYAVSFSESVTGVDSADFTTSTSGGVASTSISVTGSGATYTVTILGITGTGSISLNLIDNDTIRNSTSQPLGGTNFPGVSFTAKTDYSTGTSSGPHAITTGLINADGFTDIITANRFNSKISVLLGFGDGTFNTQTTFNTGNTPQSITTGDINGDSKLDLVTANNFNDSNIPGTVSIFLGNGNNSFISKPAVATENGPLSVVLGDFNADTKLDIATANYGSNSISIFLGNGNGTFIAATNFATGSGPKSVAMGDINGDGFLDLATANFTAPNSLERLSLLLGNGDGSFKAPIALTAGTKPFSVIMADVNGDGKKDLISANYNSANVSILLGNGNGTFQSATSASTGTRPVSVAAADLDGDGKIDLAVANSYNNIVSPINSISLLAGNGDGTFKTAVNFTTGTTPYSVTIADINGDSKPDIATANEGSDNISVFLNTTNNPANFTGQTYTVDATAPTIAISSNKTTLKIGETANLTFTLSEAASTALISSNITVTGGALSNFAGSGLTYTAIFTPTANITTTATFNVAAATFTDAAGNNNTAATQLSITVDTVAPTITIASNKTTLKIGETANLTFTLSEPASTALISSNITVAGGALSNFAGSGLIYTATFTPTANSTTAATFNVAAATFTDAAGNNNTAATQFTIQIDTTAPTITITSSASALKSGQTATLTFTLSEAASTALISSNITVTGGALSNFSGSGTSYTATFTPSANSTATATINIAGATFTDAAGNNNTAATQFTIQIDTTAPTINISSDKSTLKAGETAILTFTLNESSSTALIFSNITVTGGALSGFSGSGTSYTATFTPTANITATATFNVAAATFTDTAGNNNTASNTISITVDTTAPTITIASNKTALRIGETATITFTLSEAASDFTQSDITVVGGALSNFAGSSLTYTATFTPTSTSTTTATFNVLANTFTDSAGNPNTVSNTISITVDTVAPTITIASNKTTLKIEETANLTFTLSEPASTALISSNITVVGGALSSFSGSGTSYTAVFTPTANSTTAATFNVAAATFTDAAGNNNTAAIQFTITVDTVAPTITITSNKSPLKSGETATLTFTLSEAASTALISSNITVVGGALSNFTGSGTSYTATFTPTNNSTTTATINILANTFTDAAGNNNTAASQLSINIDTAAPTINISSDKSTLKAGETANLTFTLSESLSNFAIGDVTATGGALSNFSGSGLTYTATFTPTANSTTTATFNVAAGTFTDAAGNNNTVATQLSVTVDTISPTVTITSNKTALKSGETATLTFTLSEPASDFIASDIVTTGGTLSALTTISSTSYTAVFTPNNNSTTPATINVLANTFTDTAGNNNTASNTISITVDTVVPTITIASNKTALRIGETATITFTLSEAASTALISSNITVTGGALSNFAGSGLTYTATFTPTASSTTTATINVAGATFTDAAGNNNTAATQLSVTVDTTAPTIAITSNKTALKSGETANLTFTLSEAASTALISSNITVTGGALSNFTGSGTSYTATFTPNTNSTTTATINVLANTFTDTAGNNNTASNTISITVDTTSPTITIASNKTALKSGETANLTFTLSEAASTALISSNITVTGGALSNFSGSGTSYTATFTPSANSTATATINVAGATFTDAAGNNNTAATQFTIQIDTTAPTITITSSASAIKSGQTANLTFTLSEAASTALISSNITVTGGALSNFAGSGLTYTATFTPTASSTTTATINVVSGTFTDAAGNNNTAATQFTIQIDTTAPTITITSSASALKSGQTATLTFTLSEAASTALISSNITVVGGALSNFAGSGLIYTATFTPSANSTATATINVAGATFTDTAGNNNTAATQFAIQVDTTAPTITITSDKTALKSGETANLTFTLSEASSTALSSSNITVAGGALSNFAGSGLTYTATFTPTANTTATATFNVLANTFTDTAGNNNTAATQLSVAVDTTSPSITIASNKTALKSGETANLTFTLSEAASTALISSNITVTGGALSNFSGSGTSYTATFTPTVTSTTTATINVAAGTFTDTAGNPNTASNTISITVDTTAPTITISSNKTTLMIGETATLTFTLSEASSTALISSNITTVGGTLGTLSGAGTSYTAVFTPTTNSTTTATINVLANTFTDTVGNPSIASNTISITVDTTIPAPSPAPTPAPSPAPTPAPSPAPSPAPTPTPSPTPTPPRMMTASSSSLILGESSTVNLIDQDSGKQVGLVTPFPGFSGELRIASADMNQDGKMETIIAAGPGGGPAIMVMDSETGAVLKTFFAFDPAFKGGIFVAIADFNSDGIMDIVVGAGSGGGPHIKIFDGLTQNVLRSFFAYQENFNGGVSVAAIDINEDGFAELVTGTGSGGSSHVKVFDGKTFEIVSQWYAYPSDFKGGIFVAVGDIGNDGRFEVVTGAGEGGGPVVAIWDPYTGALLNQFLAYDENFRGGARVGISDGNGDGITDLLTGAGPGGGPQVNGYSFPALDLLFSFYSGNPNNAGGVFVS